MSTNRFEVVVVGKVGVDTNIYVSWFWICIRNPCLADRNLWTPRSELLWIEDNVRTETEDEYPQNTGDGQISVTSEQDGSEG